MTFLPDVNVWIAIAVAEHSFHREALNWLETTGQDDLAFCRVSQMGLLRLLTNIHVMKEDCLAPRDAWRLFDRLCDETGARLVAEPETLDRAWRVWTAGTHGGPNSWTDAYLSAFAQARGFTVVTFDRGMTRYGKASVLKTDRA